MAACPAPRSERPATPNALLRAHFLATLTELEETIARLGRAIVEDDAGLWAWSCRIPGEPAARDHHDERTRIAADLARIDHLDSDASRLRTPAGDAAEERDGRPIVIIAALAAARAPTLALAAEVNTIKDRLATLMHAMHAARLSAEDLLEAKAHWVGARLLRYQLRHMSRTRLSWAQSVRHIRIESETPLQASYFWADMPLRYRRTAQQLRDRLSRLADADNHAAGADLARLAALATPLCADDPVIIERPAHLHPRCNLTFPAPAEGPRRRITRVRRAVMPILYPAADPPGALVLRRPLRPYQPPEKPRAVRADSAIGERLPLQSLTAYRATPRP